MKQETAHSDGEISHKSNTKDKIVSMFVAADESFASKPDEE
jgi:hypothetical protein